MKDIEYHPLPFFLPVDTQLIMLGSFPPKQERWSMNFFYPNFQNDMWRIFGLIFFQNKDHFLLTGKKAFDEDRIKKFLIYKRIGLGDTAKAIIRHKDNASDNFLEVVEPTDLSIILKEIPLCRAIVTTGQKATDTLISFVQTKEPKIGSFSEFEFEGRLMRLYRMPSSSRAYPKSLAGKAEIYQTMFGQLGLL
ncbi:G:T/U-mismatch repair DNA glycosylase [Dysgonomonas alginatilytica]|uniref:G:T/U-mismatch repair DNA glycosylase n=1 Tax=Dysgonomonas alginatilytica TaxID=1605892 RepID=A0A2V3PR52_9BACT|nr:uracil-DNA glycosylase family protein [Dysgonomonas alginatilytica]PXV64454.1 G:T/U-mismatch repair DNA glycosylase [Dysgonomonas alginatilytica]